MGEQEMIDRVVSLRGKLKDITNRIEYMEDIIDKTILHNIGAKMRIQMDSFPINTARDNYEKQERIRYGEDDNERGPDEAPDNDTIGSMLSGIGFQMWQHPQSNQPFKNTQRQEVSPIDIRLDESEVIMMIGAILNLTRNRKDILQKEYKKAVRKLEL